MQNHSGGDSVASVCVVPPPPPPPPPTTSSDLSPCQFLSGDNSMLSKSNIMKNKKWQLQETSWNAPPSGAAARLLWFHHYSCVPARCPPSLTRRCLPLGGSHRWSAGAWPQGSAGMACCPPLHPHQQAQHPSGESQHAGNASDFDWFWSAALLTTHREDKHWDPSVARDLCKQTTEGCSDIPDTISEKGKMLFMHNNIE